MTTKELILDAISDLTEEDAHKNTLTDSQRAFQELEKLKRPFDPPIENEKEECYRYLEEKYNSCNL
ncbi:hypothetical protein IJT10_07750 [bacterium]|nr:hypothetical protein [bacterium]